MALISVQLSDELKIQLIREAELAGKSCEVVVQEAIAEYLNRKEREQFMAEMITAATALAADPAAMAESLEIANDFDSIDEGLDAIIDAERAAGIDPNQKWWK